ncbi:hypothetical protein B296_00001778 [Ensete ventricosum]|uniref:Uncharacterized protein n=1 Tax=Ensete ventricosum TaxID=4639 RepID=A0A427A5W8_ENSVE|nr:hypothetical protein B296_00001778 [Ensete ventricosum]
MTFKTLDAVGSGFKEVFGGSLNSDSAESSPLAPNQPKLLLFLADKDPSANRSRCAGTWILVAVATSSLLY